MAQLQPDEATLKHLTDVLRASLGDNNQARVAGQKKTNTRTGITSNDLVFMRLFFLRRYCCLLSRSHQGARILVRASWLLSVPAAAADAALLGERDAAQTSRRNCLQAHGQWE
jgi:hypothetical protein